MTRCTSGILHLVASSALVLALPYAYAQAPASAPAGANGICKDGSYSTAASKDGACRGHKGVQTWYSAAAAKGSASSTTTKGFPAAAATKGSPATAASPVTPVATRGAASSTPQVPPAQATAAPATRGTVPPQAASQPAAPAKPGISAERAKLATMQPAAGGGPGLVWLNGSSKVYHCPGSEFYGKTKTGAYVSESDAKAKGAHADHNKPCS